MKLTNLMSELVKRNGSDLHLTGDSYPFFRIQGQILPASSEQYSSKELRADLTQILGNEKLAKFDKEKVINKAFSAAFNELVSSVIITSDKPKIQYTKLDEIKYLIESFEIKNESFLNKKYIAKFNVNFNKKRALNFFEIKNIFLQL